MQPPPGGPRPVGRPSSDPDRDEARASEKATISKFIQALPKAATDQRVAVYRLKGRRGTRHDNRPIAKILLTDLEEARSSGTDPEDYILDTLSERFGDQQMRVLCVPQDSHGKRLTKLASWEMNLNLDEDDDMDEEFENEEDFMPGFDPMAQQQFYQNMPPPAPPGNDDTALREAKGLLANQREAEQSHTAMMMAMMQQQSQVQQQSSNMMMQLLMTQQQDRERQAERQREEERRYNDERRKEEQHRAEERQREEQRRSESRLQLIATMVPAAMPMLQKIMDGKEDKIMPILLAKLMEKSDDNSSMGQMFNMLTEAQRQQVINQGEMMRQQMSQQGEMSQSMINHVLSMAMKSVEAQRQLETNKDDGPMDTFMNVIQGIAPLLQGAQGQGSGPVPQMVPQQAPVMPPPQPVQQPPRSTLNRSPSPSRHHRPLAVNQPVRAIRTTPTPIGSRAAFAPSPRCRPASCPSPIAPRL